MLEAFDIFPARPCLEIIGDVAHGIIRLRGNFEEYEERSVDGGWYRLQYKISHNLYGEWREVLINQTLIDRDFFLRVPMLLYPYELSFTFTVIIHQFSEENENPMAKIPQWQWQQFIVQYSQFNVLKENENSWDFSREFVSKMYKIQIPSFLVQPTLKINEPILHQSEDQTDPWLRGKIINILSNGQFVVKSEDRRALDSFKIIKGHILTLDSSKIIRRQVGRWDIIDITDQKALDCDLILKTNDEQKYEMYSAIFKEIKRYCNEALIVVHRIDDFTSDKHEPITTAIAWNVYEYLYRADYKYRFDCLLCNRHLYFEQLWREKLRELSLTSEDIEDIERAFTIKITEECNLCRQDIFPFEYAYHCECNEPQHDFCIPCIHSVLLQCNQMMSFMTKLLRNVLNGHCIEEIVTFCVGKAIRFNQDCTDDEHNQEEDTMNEIEKV